MTKEPVTHSESRYLLNRSTATSTATSTTTTSARVTSRRYAKPHRPRAIEFANIIGVALSRLGVRASLTERSLVAAARRSSGLHFVAGREFREPLRRLLQAIEEEAHLNPVGRIALRQVVSRNLANRLRIDALLLRHPEIEDIPVEAPVFVVGLRRTGTTLMQRLLAKDPGLRALSSWEGINPAPLSEKELAPGELDPRMRIADMAEKAIRYMAPDFFAVHPVEARGQEEDSLVFDPSFFTTTAEALMNIPSFTTWLESIDHEPAYREYKRVLQVLLWQRPGADTKIRWLGKTLLHLEHLDALLEVFPDAKIVQTHRDPTRTVASLCSMLAHARGVFSDEVDPRVVGSQWLDKTHRMVTRGMAARGELGERPFIDVQYADFVADPLKQIVRIGEFIGRPLDAATEEGMRRFLSANPQHRHGRHAYQLEDFGLDRESVSRRFAAYRERFDVPEENPNG